MSDREARGRHRDGLRLRLAGDGGARKALESSASRTRPTSSPRTGCPRRCSPTAAGGRPRAAGDHRRRRRSRPPAGHARLRDPAAGHRRAGPAQAARRARLAALDRADAGRRAGRHRRGRRRPQRRPARRAHPRGVRRGAAPADDRLPGPAQDRGPGEGRRRRRNASGSSSSASQRLLCARGFLHRPSLRRHRRFVVVRRGAPPRHQGGWSRCSRRPSAPACRATRPPRGRRHRSRGGSPGAG